MARASILTLLSLDEWAATLGISPWELNSMKFPGNKSAQCKDVFQQYQWQNDHLSREEVAQVIADAESMIADQLLYWPAPKYFEDEVVPYPRPHQRELYGFAGTPRGEWKTVGLKWHKVISGGVFNRSALGTISGSDLTASDLDADGVKETFTATITNAAIGSITDPNEIGLYFAAANRHGEDISETWRIRPVRVSISGNTATITGHRALLVNPVPEFQVDPQELVATDDANYVTSVECYRAFTDSTATESAPYQGVAIWKNDPTCTQDCTFSLKELCLGQHDNDQGQVFASFGSSSTWPFTTREPDRLQVNYVAGLPRENGKIQADMARCIAYLSVSLLAHEKCGCDRTNRIMAKWREPITRFVDNSAKAAAYASASNPFPVTQGGLWAWSRVKVWKHVEIVSL